MHGPIWRLCNPQPRIVPAEQRTEQGQVCTDGRKIRQATAKHNISRIVGFYLSVLEHEWVIIIEADSAHDIETMCIDAGISAFNTVKIVPLSNFDAVMKRIKGS